MSDNPQNRLLGPPSKIFASDEVLYAADLNEAFEALRWEAALRAAAPQTPGLFRPWWCEDTINRIWLQNGGAQISSLFLMAGNGRPVHVPTAKVPIDSGQWLWLTLDGEVDAGSESEVPREAIRLAHKRDRRTLTIKAEIATIDATKKLAGHHCKAKEIADDWVKALLSQPAGHNDNLANAFASVLGSGSRAASALGRLAHAADSVGRRLADNDGRDAELRELTTPPRTLEVSAVGIWLEEWSKVLGDRAIQARILSEGDWLSPIFRAPGTALDGRREHRFDISHLGRTDLELHTSGALECARWRFGESDGWRCFDNPRRVPDGWRATLPAATSGTLSVQTKSETVRLRRR